MTMWIWKYYILISTATWLRYQTMTILETPCGNAVNTHMVLRNLCVWDSRQYPQRSRKQHRLHWSLLATTRAVWKMQSAATVLDCLLKPKQATRHHLRILQAPTNLQTQRVENCSQIPCNNLSTNFRKRSMLLDNHQAVLHPLFCRTQLGPLLRRLLMSIIRPYPVLCNQQIPKRLKISDRPDVAKVVVAASESYAMLVVNWLKGKSC